MVDFVQKLQENRSIWDYLEKTDKPIVLYGMGDGAEKIIKALEKYNKRPYGVFASDDFVRGQFFLNYKVKKYSDFLEELGSFIVLVSFGTQRPEVIENILKINMEQETYAPNVPLFGEGLFDYKFVCSHEKEFAYVYENLADEKSKEVFLDICNYSISGKINYLMNAVTEKTESWEILNLNDDEVYVDLGAYNGDTVLEFVAETKNCYKQILAVEPDGKNFKKLLKNTDALANVCGINYGIWDEEKELFFSSKSGRNSALSEKGTRSVKCLSVDNIQKKYACAPVSYIKMDVEGVEKQALLGGKKTLAEHKPKMLVSAYHRNEDIYALPLLVWKLNPNYKIYLRHHLYIPGWENNYYCI